MEDKRKSFTDNEKLLLFNEVDGYCPLCNEKLTYFKNGKIYKLFEIAHIYPLNPTSEEKEELKESPRLDSDVNSLNNVLAVCPKCHTKFDNPRTKEEYMLWYELKKKLILEENLRDNYSFFNLEEEIKEILSKLDNDQLELQETPLSYNSLKIEEKTNDTLPSHVKRTIKHDVVDYFDYIKEIFIELDKVTPNKFAILAMQIKSFYLKCSQETSNQYEIFQILVDWMNKKTDSVSPKACEIVVSYFIQDCEVFS